MVLTDNDISAKNFKKFYQAIYPYLKGAYNTGYTPVGAVVLIMGMSAPLHYLICDGAVYNINQYPLLADYFADQFGACNVFGGNGTTTFAVPDFNSGANSTPVFTLLPSNLSPIFCISYEDYYVEPLEQYILNSPMLNGCWEDGSAKYRVNISGTTINSTDGTIATGLTGIAYAELVRFQVSNGTYVKNLLDSAAIKLDGTQIAMVADPGSLFKNKTFYATIDYKLASS